VQYIGRIGYEKCEKKITLDSLPREYLRYKKVFLWETAEKIPPQRTFDYSINLKEGAEALWGPIYPMSQYQLDVLAEYLADMLKQERLYPVNPRLELQSFSFQNRMVDFTYVSITLS